MIEQFVIAWETVPGVVDYIPVEGLPFSIKILDEEYKFFAHFDPLGRAACSHANSGKRVCFLDRVDVKHAEREVWGLAMDCGLPIFTYVCRKG